MLSEIRFLEFPAVDLCFYGSLAVPTGKQGRRCAFTRFAMTRLRATTLALLSICALGCTTINSQSHFSRHLKHVKDSQPDACEQEYAQLRRILPAHDQFIYGGTVNSALQMKNLLVSKDGQAILGIVFGGPFLALDLGLSLVADTVVLPVAIFQSERLAAAKTAATP